MFKHSKCGGKHETIAQARACEAGQEQLTPEEIRESEPVPAAEVWPWAEPKAPKTQPARPAYPAKRPISDKKFKPLGVAYAEALAVRNGDPFEPAFIAPAPAPAAPTYSEDQASEKQVSFIQILMAERDWRTGLDNDPYAQRVADGLPILKSDASSLIVALKALPKSQATPAKSQGEQPWRKLSREVPAGNYKLTDEEGKNRFYRVSVGDNGYYKLQERASEELFFIPLSRYADILRAIVATGVDQARRAYAADQTRCWHCNTKLTDNTGNPHYSRGLGPKCGEEN